MDLYEELRKRAAKGDTCTSDVPTGSIWMLPCGLLGLCLPLLCHLMSGG